MAMPFEQGVKILAFLQARYGKELAAIPLEDKTPLLLELCKRCEPGSRYALYARWRMV